MNSENETALSDECKQQMLSVVGDVVRDAVDARERPSDEDIEKLAIGVASAMKAAWKKINEVS